MNEAGDNGGIPSWARVGAKVVCIKHATNPITLAHPHPIKDCIYTIRKVVTNDAGSFGLLLREIVLATWTIGSRFEPGFVIEGFRPLVTRSQDQDVAQFRKLLAHQPEGVDA